LSDGRSWRENPVNRWFAKPPDQECCNSQRNSEKDHPPAMIHDFLSFTVVEQVLPLLDRLHARCDGQESADYDQNYGCNNCCANIQVHCLHYSIRNLTGAFYKTA